MTGKSKRIEWIDCAKGIAIILVVVGHTVLNGKYASSLRGMIFSFHMPLFFILSCMTFRCSKDMEQYKRKSKRAFEHLVGPAIIVFVLGILIECIKNTELIGDMSYWKQEVYCLIFASGVDTEFNQFTVRAIGIPWFFFALFIGRTIFDYIHLCVEEKQLCLFCWISCFAGIFFGSNQWLPFSMDIALAIMPFFYYGYKMKGMNLTEHVVKKLLIWGGIWAVTLFLTFPDYREWTYLEFASRRYNFFPVCYLTAVAGTMMISEISVLLTDKMGKLMTPILYIGRNSLYFLCVHIMDNNWKKIWFIKNHQFYSVIIRTIVDLIVFAVVMAVITAIKKKTGQKKEMGPIKERRNNE